MSHPAANLRPAVFLDRDGTLMEEVHYCADPALVRLFPGTAAALRRLTQRGFLCVIITNQSGIGRGLLTEAQYHAVQAELLRQLGTQEEEEDQELRNSGGEEKSGNQETRKENEREFREQVRSQMEFGNEETQGKEDQEIRNSGGEKPEEVRPESERNSGEPEGFEENSRGLSEATPPEPGARAPHPKGVADSSLIAASYFCPDAPPTPSPRRKPEPGMVWEAARDLGIDLARSWFVGDKAADIQCGARAGTRTILVQTGYGAQTAVQSLDPAPDFIVKDIAAAVDVIVQNSDAIRP